MPRKRKRLNKVHAQPRKLAGPRINIFSNNKGFVVLTFSLLLLGILAVADASAPQAVLIFGDPFFFVRQQIVWTAIGIVALIVCANIPYTVWKKYAFVIFLVAIGMLLMVLIPGVGSKLLGARRWISIGPVTIQPSEIAKLALAIFIARLIDEKYPFTWIAGVIALIVGLVMLQPDLGTTISIVAIGFVQLFVSGIPVTMFLGMGAAGVIGGLFLILTSGYRRQRLMTFLESSSDPLGTSYHMRQILIALGSGGLFGVGIGQSRQKHLFLPESATDSVFAVIAEELGFVGSVALILLLLIFVFKCFKIAQSAPDTFSKMLAVGIATWIGGQMLLNLSSMVALTPLTGIPLPFFSYGGSSLLTILAAVGILINISRYAKDTN